MTAQAREIDPTDPPALAPGEVFVKRPFGGVDTFHTRRCQNLVQMARAYVVPSGRVPEDAAECTHCRGEHRGPLVREQDWSFQASLLGGEVGPDGKTIVTDGGEAADCGRCGRRHPSMEAAMRCCDDAFDEPEPLTDGGEVIGGLRCPVPSCDERFHDRHDEGAVATLVYHLGRAHSDLLEAIESKLGGGRPRTDGGVDASPYTVPTGPGYVTVARVSRGPQISIGIVTAPVDWSGGTSVECWVERGAIAVDKPDGRDRERIATQTVYQRPSRGIRVNFTNRVIEELDVEVGDDVRIYERDGGGFWLVPADDDPFLEAP